jgi:hypothetical protein
MNQDNDNEDIDYPQAEQAEQVTNENNTDIEAVTKNRLKSFLSSHFSTDDAEETEATEDDSNQVESRSNDSEQEDNTEATENEDDEEVLSHSDEEDGVSGNLSRGVKKRIDKLTAKRREAESEVERLKQELEQAKTAPQSEELKVSHANVPFSNLNTMAEIEAETAQARSVKRWCEEHSDGYTVENEDGSERHYSKEEITQIKLNAIDALEEHLPKRTNYIRTKEQVEPVAKKVYGNIWGKMETRERKIADAFLKAFPEITKFPDYKILVGDLVTGMSVREQKSKNPNQVVKKAPSMPRPSSAAPKANSVDRLNAAERRFSKTGDKSDLKDIILNKFL